MIRFCRIAASFVFILALGQAGPAAAQQERDARDYSTLSLDEIAIDIVNPVGDLSPVLNRFDYISYQGDLPGVGDQSKFIYELTPVIPIGFSNGKKLIIRATLPISFGTPAYVTGNRDYADWLARQRADTITYEGSFVGGHGHLDDITYDVAYGGVNENGLISMFGVAGVLPTSQDGSIERDQYLLGPELALGKITDWGIIGAWATHLFDVAESVPTDYSTNETSIRIFYAMGLGNGWQLISNPEIVNDWEAADNNKLMLPLGGGVSKTLRLGRIPMKMDLELYGYVETADVFGPEWLLTFSISPLMPNWFNR